MAKNAGKLVSELQLFKFFDRGIPKNPQEASVCGLAHSRQLYNYCELNLTVIFMDLILT